MHKIIASLLFLLSTTITFAQKKQLDYQFGNVSIEELEMKTYSKDSTANAVVLYEHGYSAFFEFDYRIYLRTTIYKKIKILKSEGKEYADVEIILYNNDHRREKVDKITAITHFNGHKFSLKPENIYTTKISDNHTKVAFAMPKVSEGSVIEYTYTVVSPFYYNLTGWDFQDFIPKIESVYKAKIPGNYLYNRNMVGSLPLEINNSEIIKRCFSVSGIAGMADCELLHYSMKDIPAFIDEDYMTSNKNFMARIAFELSEFRGFNGKVNKYTTTWDAVDRDFKKDNDIGGQLKRNSFFKDVLSEDILVEENSLLKAQKIYEFIQNHYTWNNEYKLFRNANVKRAYKNGVGTIGEINISLINALKASGLNAKMGLLSTRKNGSPTKIHPVISDFNYLIAHLEIDGKFYLLDATEKKNPFGILPFRCLNRIVRIMDFENGSYWEDVNPNKKNRIKTNLLVHLNDNGDLEGQMRVVYTGYKAVNKRTELSNRSNESHIEKLESNNDALYIEDYKSFNVDSMNKQLKEEFKLKIENDLSIPDKIILNPFIFNRITENPFKLEQRSYPVDFGYPRETEFIMSLEIPDNYEVESIPKNINLKLPDNNGLLKFSIDTRNYKVRVHFKFVLNKAYFYSGEYKYLKEFYNQIVLAQSQPIILKKILPNAN